MRMSVVARRIAVLTAVVVGLSVVPAGSVPEGGTYPLSWLWTWIPQSPASAAAALLGVPVQQRGSADDKSHYVPASATDANGLARGPKKATPEPKPWKVLRKEGVFDPATSKRVATEATATSDLFENADGTYSRKVFRDPVNFQAKDGSWQPINRSLVKGADGRFEQKAAPTVVTLAGSASDASLVTLRMDDSHAMSYGLVGAAAVAGVAQENSTKYPDVLPGVDVKLEVTGSGAKESLILHSAQAPSSFVFPLDLQGLTATLEANGSVVLRDEAGEVRASIPAGFMQDSKFDAQTGDFTRSDAVKYELITVDGKPAVRVTADSAWLRDPARVYPVIIDPSSFMTTGDTYVYKTDLSDHGGENNLAMGTYDGGTHVARSLLQFNGFSSTYNGATISAVSLAAHLTWTYDCTPRTFNVKAVTSSWAVTAQWPGPSLGAVIGSATPSPGAACTNTSADRAKGVWVTVPLTVSAIQSWLTGGANYGLALTAPSETTSNQWKRFTSRNFANYAYQPYLILTYSGPGSPQVDGVYPPSGYNSATLTPILIAEAHDPDNSGGLTYDFVVFDDSGNLVVDSGWVTSSSWQVPASKLTRGRSYSWTVTVNDGTSLSSQRWSSLSTLPPQPLVTSALSQNGGKGFEPSAGNYTTSATDASIPTVGPPLAVSRSYNSQDPRTSLAFGAGWSSVADMKVVEVEKDGSGIAQTVSITYPSGQEVVFGKKSDGTFAPPLGRFATLSCANATFASITCPTATGTTITGYRLLDKDGTTYTFTNAVGTDVYGITSMADYAGRTETFTYTSGKLSKITSASGRSLNLTWTAGTPAHVATVYTDPATAGDSSTVSTWIYTYTDDLLTEVCPPTSTTACTKYEYALGLTPGSLYPSVVRNLAPTSNWRLTEASGTTAASAVLDQGGADNGIYSSSVTLGQDGPVTGSTAKAAGFNGSDSSVALPISLSNESGYRSASVWFKTTTAGRVLLSQSTDPLSAGTTNWGYSPTLYVDSNGKLAGQFPTAPAIGPLGSLVGPGSGRCVDIAGSSTADGAAVQLYDCNGTSAQQWVFNASNRISTVVGGVTKCLDVTGFGTANGTVVQSWTCGTGTNQQWKMLPNGQIIGVGSGKCLDATGFGTANGTRLQIWTCASSVARNQTWFASAHTPMASTTVVTDGQWHHAVLSASGNSQTLYLDGAAVGAPKTGLVVGGRQKYQYIGAGFLGGGWPNQSYGIAGTNKGTASYFTGTIGEVAFFDKPLTQNDVTALKQARETPARQLKKIIRPSGGVTAAIDYDGVTGVVSQVIDENGGVWKVDPPTVEGSYLVHSSAVLGASPTDYWRFAETDATDAVNEVNGGTATYFNGVTLGAAPGPFGESTRAATFDGTSAHVKIPQSDIPLAGPFSIGMWFRVPNGSTAGGTLFGYQNQPLGTTPTSWNPALYVGTDGRLRGELWIGSVSPRTSVGTVNDGNWHHVVLAAGANTQTLYLDGAVVGTPMAGTIAPNGTTYAYIGAGGSANWPNAKNTITGYFTGDIAEVAIYKDQQLSGAQVGAQFAARNKALGTGLIKKYLITDPSLGKLTSQSFALPSGRKVATTDALGNQTIYGFDADTGFLETVADANGNYTESKNDARGNTTQETTCQDRSAVPAVCSTVYRTYQLNGSNPLDPCNDKLATSRDGRSASSTDITYLTSYTYDSKCNIIVVTDPLGRKTVTSYTGDKTTAAVDGGYVPAGLPTKVTSAAGAVQSISYYSSGDIASMTDPAGKVTGYTYDSLGRIITKKDTTDTFGTGLTMTMTYDKQSRVLTQTQPTVTNRVTGAVHTARTTLEYDLDGHTKSQTVTDLTGGDAARSTTTEFNVYGQQWKVTDATGKQTAFEYDNFGRMVKQTRPDGVVMLATYDVAGQLLTSVVKGWTGDPNSPSAPVDLTTTSKAYDPAGRVASETDAMGWKTICTYLDNGQVAKIIRTDGAATNPKTYVQEENFYDLAGNLVKRITNNGATTTTFHVDAASRTDSSTLDPTGLNRTTSVVLDADNRVQSTTTKTGTTVLGYSEASYDPMGRVLSQTVYNGPAGTNPLNVATGRWKLDATTGTTASDLSGNNPGTASGGVTWSTDHGGTTTTGSAVFDGTGVITGTTAAVDTSSSFTVAAWAKLDPAAAAPVVIASQDGAKVSGFTLYYNKSTNLWTFSMPRSDATAQTVEAASSSTAASTGVWTHVAGVYDAAGKTLKVYVNGVLAGTTTRTAGPWSAPGKLIIGGGKSGGDLNGRVDLVGRDGSGNLLLYPNNGGPISTTLGAGTQILSGFSAMTSINVADFTGDGKTDVIARDSAGDLWVYPNTGTTGTVTFGPPSKLGTGWNSLNWIGTGDANDDGRADILGRDSAGDLWLYLNSGGTGTGSLAPDRVLIGTGWTGMNWIGTGDVNGDGKFDLLGRNSANNLYYYLNTGGTGASKFGGSTLAGTGWGGYEISTGDLNGDGRVDLIARGSDSLLWMYPNVGGTGFGARSQIGSSWSNLNLYMTANMDGDTPASWRGSINDVQVYQRALSVAEIANVKGGTLPAANSSVARTSYTVDNGGLAKSATDPLGNVTDYSHDEAGRVAVATSPQVTSEVFGGTPVAARAVSYIGYDTFGGQTEVKNPNQKTTTVAYDALGRVTSTTAPSYTPPGSSTPIVPVTTNVYDPVGQLIKKTDPLGKDTTFVYDQLGRLAKTTAPDLGVTKATYDLLGEPLSVTDPTGAIAQTTYDFLGRQATSTQVVRQDSTNYTTTYTYSPYTYGTGGWLASVQSPANVTMSMTYNAAGETLTARDGANSTTTFEYDGAGRKTKTKLADNTYTTVTYDLAGRVGGSTSYDALNNQLTTVSSGYDNAGNVVWAKDARGTTNTFTYDATNLLVSQVQPISGTDNITTSFGYDPGGNRTRFTDGRGNAFWTSYNSWGLPESQIEPATSAFPNVADGTFTTAYDAAGRPVSLQAPGGVTTTYAYDVMGRLTSQTGTGAEATTADRTFGYDLAGRITSLSGSGGTNALTYDDRGLLRSAAGPSGNSSFTYTPDGPMASRTDAAGTTAYTYDPADRLSVVSNTDTGVKLRYGYNTLSQPSSITSITPGTPDTDGATRWLSYDDLHRLTVDELKTSAGATVGKITYGWDENGNETSKTTTGFAGSASNSYTYDLANRLSSWTAGSTTTAYAYDKAGNRVQAGTKTFTYDQRNQLLTSPSSGTSYVYTPRGTLRQTVTGTVGLDTLSDAFGQVAKQYTTPVTSQDYTYDGLGRAIRIGFSYTGVGNTLAADGITTYTRGVGGDLLGVAQGITKTIAWIDLHTDVVGQYTSTSTTLAGSTSYDPFGKVLASTGMIGNLGYQSGWTDNSTGRVNMLARWYNTDTGQFDTRDSVSNNPTPDSVNANRYAYANASPLVNTDPTGHWSTVQDDIVANAFGDAADWGTTTAANIKVNKQTRKKVRQKEIKKRAEENKKRKPTVNDASCVGGFFEGLDGQGLHVCQNGVSGISIAGGIGTLIIGAEYNCPTTVDVPYAPTGRSYPTKTTCGWGPGDGRKLYSLNDYAQTKYGQYFSELGREAQREIFWWTVCNNNPDLCDQSAGSDEVFSIVVSLIPIAGIAYSADQCYDGDNAECGWALLGLLPGAGLAKLAKLGKLGKLGKSLEQMLVLEGSGLHVAGDIAAFCSFTGDTEVLMADGTAKPIRDISLGDRVQASDPLTGGEGAREVTALWVHEDSFVKLEIAGEVLKTTEDHPFWNDTDKEWQRADELDKGDAVHTADGKRAQVDGIAGSLEAGTAYNLTIADIHTYYVLAGPVSILVHNTCATAVLGVNPHSNRLAGELGDGAFTFNGGIWGELSDISGRPKWMEGVEGAISDSSTRIVVTLDGLPGKTAEEAFANAYQRGLPLQGADWRPAAAYGNGTAWEMAKLGNAVRFGKRDWSSIQFYWNGGPVKLSSPDWPALRRGI